MCSNIYSKNVFRSIKLLILDVDGVLTDGKITLSNSGDEYKNFNVKDGMGIVLLQKVGIRVAIITSKESNIVLNRLTSLGLNKEDIYQGQKNKIKAYQEIKEKYNLKDTNIAYMGDDLPDIAIMDKVFLSAAPADCVSAVKKFANYICSSKGGYGAVRELCDFILKQEGLYEEVIKSYINNGELVF
ncbi:KdsC family phosphatase [Pseudofrancisella aestuarii]|uniref:3-deoxy-D-manno-octulosonate 8-phosphate phosphatase KdsC n=2 Tax=Francisellaceae TaxID=34064 RepID=A0A1J0KVV5_9GAMM|nr:MULTISPECIES: HAD-IIIA family hydrolase [Francisellaceae]APC97847.1 3-deoxy-D-manno-octulosonate 8-phosphate phosphatase, YrbI family protein [Francisella frigiditurris]